MLDRGGAMAEGGGRHLTVRRPNDLAIRHGEPCRAERSWVHRRQHCLVRRHQLLWYLEGCEVTAKELEPLELLQFECLPKAARPQ